MPNRRARCAAALVVALALFCGSGRAAVYFFDSNAGSDGNAGTRPDAPMQSLQKLATLDLVAGDTVRLRRGRTFRGRLILRGNGARQGITGDFNVVENNVIGLCPEESIDITSGDYHLIQGNICYGNGNPGIIVGHDSDHILIRNNISFNNARADIQIGGNPDEGSRGENVVVRNLVYGNGCPGLEIQGANTMVLNNTVLDSTERVEVRFNPKARGTHLYNNVIVTTDPHIRHASVQFMLGSPASCEIEMDHNLFFHAARPDGRLIQTTDGNFTPAGAAEKYGTCMHGLIAELAPYLVPK